MVGVFHSSLYLWSFIRVAAARGAYSEDLWGKTALPFEKGRAALSPQASS